MGRLCAISLHADQENFVAKLAANVTAIIEESGLLKKKDMTAKKPDVNENSNRERENRRGRSASADSDVDKKIAQRGGRAGSSGGGGRGEDPDGGFLCGRAGGPRSRHPN